MKNLKQLTNAFLLLVLPMISKPQNIYTIVGNGVAGYSGDGLSATSMYCELDNPIGVSIDVTGNIYIADENNNVIRIVNTSGIITTFAGNHILGAGFSGDNGPATDAQLNYCVGICIDTKDNIYIADQANNAVRKVNSVGIITTIAGIGVHGFSGDAGLATAAELYKPCGVYADAKNNIYIADEANNRVRKIDTTGIISTIAGNGKGGYTTDGGLADTTEIWHPFGICGDPMGNIYFADVSNCRIRRINTSGIISTIAGNGKPGYSADGGLADTTELNYPNDVYLDKNANVYISDTYNQRVRKIDNSTGIISTIAGITETVGGEFSGDGGPATAAELAYPCGITMDAADNVYFVDEDNQRIRKISISTGIEEVQVYSSVTIYPNPANQSLTINFNGLNTEPVKLTIMDITGREVLPSQFLTLNSQLSVDVSSLSSGMYFLQIKTKDSDITRKFIKL